MINTQTSGRRPRSRVLSLQKMNPLEENYHQSSSFLAPCTNSGRFVLQHTQPVDCGAGCCTKGNSGVEGGDAMLCHHALRSLHYISSFDERKSIRKKQGCMVEAGDLCRDANLQFYRIRDSKFGQCEVGICSSRMDAATLRYLHDATYCEEPNSIGTKQQGSMVEAGDLYSDAHLQFYSDARLQLYKNSDSGFGQFEERVCSPRTDAATLYFTQGREEGEEEEEEVKESGRAKGCGENVPSVSLRHCLGDGTCGRLSVHTGEEEEPWAELHSSSNYQQHHHHYYHHSMQPFCFSCSQHSLPHDHLYPRQIPQERCAVGSACCRMSPNYVVPNSQLARSRFLSHLPAQPINIPGDLYSPHRQRLPSSRQKPGLHRYFPPFPSRDGAVPYVLCQHCDRLLHSPSATVASHAATQKLKCIACHRTSTFTTISSKQSSMARGCLPQTLSSPLEAMPRPDEAGNGEERASHSTAGQLDMESRVEEWVNSSFRQTHEWQRSQSAATADIEGMGFGSDFQLTDSADAPWVLNLAEEAAPVEENSTGFDTFTAKHEDSQVVPGTPLHKHMGYKTAAELLHRALLGQDNGAHQVEHCDASQGQTPDAINATLDAPKEANLYPKRAVFVDALHDYSKGSELQANGDKSIAGFLKKSLRDLAGKTGQLNGTAKSKVDVNGHTLSSAAIKRTEERAGRLRPGSYWYDYKAGFWGVLGGPCLGVIPPFIEELNYPMPKACSNGTTQVFVNGRELHQKDLDLLSCRGLSRKPGKTYTIGFDGAVKDEATGIEVKRLGKLAPTVEGRGKGFGMFTPVVGATKLHAHVG